MDPWTNTGDVVDALRNLHVRINKLQARYTYTITIEEKDGKYTVESLIPFRDYPIDKSDGHSDGGSSVRDDEFESSDSDGGSDHDKGKTYYESGDKYRGGMQDGQRTGWGRMKYVDGDVYEGNWLDDEASGHGQMTYNDQSIYIGDWQAG